MDKEKIYTTSFNGRPVLSKPEQGLVLQADIQNRLDELLHYYTNKHSKLLFIRYDVRYPQNYPLEYMQDNTIFRHFMGSLVQYYQRQNYDPNYFWVREHSSYNNRPHYHVVFLLNGHKAQYWLRVVMKAQQLWGLALKIENSAGLIFNCDLDRYGNKQENGIMVRKDRADYEDQFNRIYEWSSYLAKDSTKGNSPRYVREYGCSRMPRQQQ